MKKKEQMVLVGKGVPLAPESSKRAGRPAGQGETPDALRIQSGRRTRLKLVIDEHFEGNQTAFASAVSMQPTGVSHLLKKRTITDEVCLKIATYVGISAQWLLSGEGQMGDPPPPPAPDRMISEGQRLAGYRQKRGMSKRALGILMGLAPGSASVSVSKYEETEQLEPKTKQALARAFQVDEAEMRAILGGYTHLVKPVALQEEKIPIPFIPVRARAGFARSSIVEESHVMYGSELDVVYVSRDVLKAGYETERSRKDKVYVIEVDGDSMEPLLHPGYEVTAYVVDPGDWPYTTGVVAVQYRDEFVIKRIRDNRLEEDGRLTLHSDNPLGGSITVPRSEIRQIFEIDEIVKGKVK
ncbi:S24 family peptidase [Fibrivirga algicola]|uniref:HTH cro/C1-type domain-containing protein n=1 Tax=Fibrivirga algicola TaxID=2950420 RepID=A0ABX0QAP6_9BACT|nr:S24 family peptidase [Fibrivirga algicola]NID09340.1 hypothetical protein [Fibrivirga algicola]